MSNDEPRRIEDFSLTHAAIDLTKEAVSVDSVACADLEDFLGGIARAFKLLAPTRVKDAYAPDAPLIVNLGRLSGTDFMTGLRTFVSGYSPLKAARSGAPGSMWSAGSGKFGTKLRAAGIDEITLTGRATRPTYVHIAPGPTISFRDATDLVGKTINEKIQALHARYDDAHFAVIGPAGEAYESVRMAAIGLSTENQLKSGDPKARYCGRGGFGGVMGSKNLLAIVAEAPDRSGGEPRLKDINLDVARGPGSRRFRDADKGNGGGGTWANYEAMQPVHLIPERNFNPTGSDASVALSRPSVEAGPFEIRDEACYRCGIRCHKNVYEKNGGKFRAKLDYEPLNLLSSNLGIFDPDQACTLVELVDELGMDSISLGATLSYAMEWNKRHADAPLADGLAFGDFEATRRVIEEIGRGRMATIGQGVLRLAQAQGEPEYAMHSKGVEYPAYLPHTNPGYPWALAGGHMSMATYLLLMYEKDTGMDYWVDAITNRGIRTLRDDVIGICKFSGMSGKRVCEGLEILAGVSLTSRDVGGVVSRTFLRGYAMEKAQGFTIDDYDMPAICHEEHPHTRVPYFNTREFFEELRTRVTEVFDRQLAAADL